MGSDRGCDCKGSRDDALPGGGEGVRWSQIVDATAKGAGTTDQLVLERERDGVRPWMRLQREQEPRTAWRWKRSAVGSDYGSDCKGSTDNALARSSEGARWGQITDATAK
jgi:hypothetical protein